MCASQYKVENMTNPTLCTLLHSRKPNYFVKFQRYDVLNLHSQTHSESAHKESVRIKMAQQARERESIVLIFRTLFILLLFAFGVNNCYYNA